MFLCITSEDSLALEIRATTPAQVDDAWWSQWVVITFTPASWKQVKRRHGYDVVSFSLGGVVKVNPQQVVYNACYRGCTQLAWLRRVHSL